MSLLFSHYSAVHISRLLRAQVPYFKFRRTANRDRRSRFFQALLRSSEMNGTADHYGSPKSPYFSFLFSRNLDRTKVLFLTVTFF